MRPFRRFALAACTAAALITSAASAAPAVESFTLKNGLEVVVIPNRRVPAVSHMLWFRVGAADDPPMASGLAHYHEHLMFKGTKSYPQGRYEQLIAAHGGRQNAFTGYDSTGYYVDIAKEKLPLVMQLEADRIRGLTPDPQEALKEREVILEERRTRVENSPQALLAEQVNAALYLNHPYHIPVIGWMHEMAQLTPEEALALHRRHYHPNNAVLVISGDVTAAQVRPLAERHYGSLPKRDVPPRRWRQEPPARAARHVTLRHANVKQPVWTRSYLAPSLVHGDTSQALPLSVLAQVLGAESTGLLYRALVVEQKLATSITTGYEPFMRGPSEFSISAVPADGVSPERLGAAIDRALEAILSGGVPEDSVRRAKRLLKAETVYAREGLQPMAYLMGTIRMLGLEKEVFARWPEMIEAVTRADTEAAARTVLQPESSVTGVLLPEETHAQE